MKTVRVIKIEKNSIYFDVEMKSIHDEYGTFPFRLGITTFNKLMIYCQDDAQVLWNFSNGDALEFLDGIYDNGINYHVNWVYAPDNIIKSGMIHQYFPTQQIEKMQKILKESKE